MAKKKTTGAQPCSICHKRTRQTIRTVGKNGSSESKPCCSDCIDNLLGGAFK